MAMVVGSGGIKTDFMGIGAMMMIVAAKLLGVQ